MESPTVPPPASFIPQRALSVAPELISSPMLATIWEASWATFQTRASSSTPSKRPSRWRAAGRDHRAEADALGRIRARERTRRDARLEVAVEIEAPDRPVERGGRVMPDVVGDDRRAGDRVVAADRRCPRSRPQARSVVGPSGRMPRIQFASTFEPSASAAPWVSSGIMLMPGFVPPVPVVLATPAPVRLNHVSIVNCARSSLAGSPKLTYAPPDPSFSPEPMPVSESSFDAVDSLLPAVNCGDDVVVGHAIGHVAVEVRRAGHERRR